METELYDIITEILEAQRDTARRGETVSNKRILALIRAHNKGIADDEPRFAKKLLLPYYRKVRDTDTKLWESWGINPAEEKTLLAALQLKPRRTASGVATITVITKPHPCPGNCIFCPNDIRMPKSYLSNEPACQRAERNYFDPYLQVASRLRALNDMGHATDKVELIVLGGTWTEYPQDYQIWFMHELFRALNEADDEECAALSCAQRRAFYRDCGMENDAEVLAACVADIQARINAGDLSYAQAYSQVYGGVQADGRGAIAIIQNANLDELYAQHAINETAAHRVVGLVIETRPDRITEESLTMMRRLGCTKIQIGVQSLDRDVLAANRRQTTPEQIARAFALLRRFGFKIHAHFMLNLLGATPDSDRADYLRFVSDPAYLPDEVKLYPCALVDGTELCQSYNDGAWQPYSEEDLVATLVDDMFATPEWTRISRMIRDIGADDILVGNKKTNLRQMVENAAAAAITPERSVCEIRFREVSTDDVDVDELALRETKYETATTTEYFLQWVTPENRIAGFCRLSLPRSLYCDGPAELITEPTDASIKLPAKLTDVSAMLPAELTDISVMHPAELTDKSAMIREVHVYGKVARLGKTTTGAQHAGLGRMLVERACDIAQAAGYRSINVISAIGTREYYRNLGFTDGELYLCRKL